MTRRANRKKRLTVLYIVEHPNQEGDTCIDWTSQYCWTNGWNCLWRGHSVYWNRPLIPPARQFFRFESFIRWCRQACHSLTLPSLLGFAPSGSVCMPCSLAPGGGDEHAVWHELPAVRHGKHAIRQYLWRWGRVVVPCGSMSVPSGTTWLKQRSSQPYDRVGGPVGATKDSMHEVAPPYLPPLPTPPYLQGRGGRLRAIYVRRLCGRYSEMRRLQRQCSPPSRGNHRWAIMMRLSGMTVLPSASLMHPVNPSWI